MLDALRQYVFTVLFHARPSAVRTIIGTALLQQETKTAAMLVPSLSDVKLAARAKSDHAKHLKHVGGLKRFLAMPIGRSRANTAALQNGC